MLRCASGGASLGTFSADSRRLYREYRDLEVGRQAYYAIATLCLVWPQVFGLNVFNTLTAPGVVFICWVHSNLGQYLSIGAEAENLRQWQWQKL